MPWLSAPRPPIGGLRRRRVSSPGPQGARRARAPASRSPLYRQDRPRHPPPARPRGHRAPGGGPHLQENEL